MVYIICIAAFHIIMTRHCMIDLTYHLVNQSELCSHTMLLKLYNKSVRQIGIHFLSIYKSQSNGFQEHRWRLDHAILYCMEQRNYTRSGIHVVHQEFQCSIQGLKNLSGYIPACIYIERELAAAL